MPVASKTPRTTVSISSCEIIEFIRRMIADPKTGGPRVFQSRPARLLNLFGGTGACSETRNPWFQSRPARLLNLFRRCPQTRQGLVSISSCEIIEFILLQVFEPGTSIYDAMSAQVSISSCEIIEFILPYLGIAVP